MQLTGIGSIFLLITHLCEIWIYSYFWDYIQYHYGTGKNYRKYAYQVSEK